MSFKNWRFILLMFVCWGCSPEFDNTRAPQFSAGPHLIGIPGDGQILLRWNNSLLCNFPYFNNNCPQFNPDYFMILGSDSDPNDLQFIGTVDRTITEFSIEPVENNKPYYFAIKSIGKTETYPISNIIMVIPGKPAEVTQIQEISDSYVYTGTFNTADQLLACSQRYSINNDGYEDIYVLLYDLTSGSNFIVDRFAYYPGFSPDGNRIVYRRDYWEGMVELGYVPTQISVFDIRDSSITRIIDRGSFDFRPVWSPDGNWIAYLSDYSGGGEYNIWKYSVPEDNSIKVSDDFNDLNDLAIIDSRSPRMLSWSPDGEFIAFDRLSGNGDQYHFDIFRIPASGGDREIIINSTWNDCIPSYSPNGKWIAFASDRSGVYEIWLMDLSTKVLRQLSGHYGQSLNNTWSKIEWSPGSDKILFTGYSGTTSGLFILNLTGLE